MLESRRFAIKLAAIFLGSSVTLAAAGWLYLSHQKTVARAAAHQELSAIADLKLRQLSNWREERLSDARFFARARFVAQDMKRFLADPESDTNRSAVLHWLNLLKSDERYDAAIVFDTRFESRLAIPSSASGPVSSVRQDLEKALQSHDVVMTDLHQDQTNGPIHIDIVFPVFEEADLGRGAPIAVVLLKLDARHFLFPLVQSWPTPSQTAETLLVRQEGNEAVYLNDLRHQPGAALNLRVPLDTPGLPAAMALQGNEQAMEGVDYRGIPVVAVGRVVPDTTWAMVAKVDRDEVYAPLRQQILAAALVLGSLLGASALLVGLLWHQRTAQVLERELALEKEHVARHKANRREIERLGRLYAALSQVNQVVLRARSREELEGEVCRVLVEFGGFQMAWIGWVNEATLQVIPVAHCGDSSGYLQGIQVFADERPEGLGPVGAAIREGRPCVFNDCMVEPKFSPWREAAVRSEWRSLAGFPIREAGRVRGALAVYSQETDFFGVREQALLEEAAADISFGLDVLLNEQRRRVAEQHIRLQAAALESAANAIAITDRMGVIQWVNPAFARLTGYSVAEAVGQTPRLLNSGRHTAEFYGKLWETILAGQVWRGELVNKRKDGSFYNEEMTITPVRDERGEITHFIAIKQDITDIVAARETLARSRVELEQLVQERTAQLVEANTSLRGFAYTAAHDLRSPLRGIANFSSIVLEDYGPKLDQQGRWMLERIVQSTGQMSGLLDGLLEYSKMTVAELRIEKISLKTAVSEALALLDADIRGTHAQVSVDDGFPDVIGHPATVVLIVSNLISNGMKFVPPGVRPQIRVWAETVHSPQSTVPSPQSQVLNPMSQDPASSIQHPGTQHAPVSPESDEGGTRSTLHDFVRLWVEDNGIGIAAADQEKLFHAFQRLHGKQAYPGAGLGLAIVRKGAERMGGRVGMESEVGKGSRFWVELRSAESGMTV